LALGLIVIKSHIMKYTVRLLQNATKLVLFSRANCSLCDTAKAVVGNVRKHRSADYVEIDVMEQGNEDWKNLYEFDTPVVCL
jgi:hypothetical protein